MTSISNLRAADDTTKSIRSLGSFENLFDLYTQDLPVQFSIIAELDRVVSAEEVERALLQVQASQPLLAAGVRRTEAGAAFYPSSRPIPLLVALSGTPWEAIATTDQAWALDVTQAPLARCTVANQSDSSIIVMTFSHQIADGISAAATVRDLVRAINGETLPVRSFPRSQETLLAEAVAAGGRSDGRPIAAAASQEAPVLATQNDPALDRRGTVRPFDSARPDIRSLVWSADLTRRVLDTARAESATLHAVLTAAAVRVMFAESTRDSLVLMNPMDLRRPTGADESLALYFLSTRLGFRPERSEDFWGLARGIRQHIGSAHTVEQLAGMSRGMAAATAQVSRVEDAVGAMVSFANYDLMISNLGDLGRYEEGHGQADVRITDLFGPTMATQIAGEQILALSTFDGRLRTTITTRNPIRGFLGRLRDEVEQAIA